MCGIAGFVAERMRDRGALLRLVEAMNAQLVHRGPDDAGIWVDTRGHCALGHRRLSIVDLSPLGHQPMHSESGRYTLVFNGEIYNHRELRKKLEALGCRFAGSSDTEVLLAGIERWGLESTLRQSNGMFAIALWDQAEQLLCLARDRLGEKPLYVWRTSRGLAFASELKPILLANDYVFEPSMQALGSLLRYGYVPDGTCIVQGAHKVRPGTIETWRVRSGVLDLSPAVVAYWQLAASELETGISEQDAIDGLGRELERVIGDQMVADVPVGSFLSGGIDSTVVTAVMQSLSAQPIRTFCVSFDDPQYDEGPYARRIAEHLGTSHTEVRISTRELQDIVGELSGIYDEPFADASQIPTVAVARAARSSVKVCLSGDGGDEVFGGYNRYYWPNRIDRWFGRWPAGMRSGVAAVLESIAGGRLSGMSGLVRKAVVSGGGPIQDFRGKLLKAARVIGTHDAADAYFDLIQRCHDPGRIVRDWAADEPAARELKESFAKEPAFSAATRWDIEHYLCGDNLVKVDRASMSVGLEMRAPLLDHHVVALGRSMIRRFGYARYEQEPKWALRALIRRFVPDELMARPKMGFSVPIADWLRGDLRGWASDLLSTDLSDFCPAIDRSAVDHLLQQHMTSQVDNSATLWPLLCFAAWADRMKRFAGARTMDLAG